MSTRAQKRPAPSDLDTESDSPKRPRNSTDALSTHTNGARPRSRSRDRARNDRERDEGRADDRREAGRDAGRDNGREGTARGGRNAHGGEKYRDPFARDERDVTRDSGARDAGRDRNGTRRASPPRGPGARRERTRSRSPRRGERSGGAGRGGSGGGYRDRDREERRAPLAAQAKNGFANGISAPSSRAPSNLAPSSKNDVKPPTRTDTTIDLNADPEDELAAQMKKTMGFAKFKTTKETKVPGNDKLYAVRKEKQMVARQYMNRVGGFNRPLSPSHQ